MGDRLLPAHHSAHQPQPQPQQQGPAAQLRQHPQQPVNHSQHLQPATSAVRPPQPNVQDIIYALPHAIDNLHRDFSTRFQRIEVFLTEHLRRISPSQSQSQPANATSSPPNITHAAFSATFTSLETKLNSIQRNFADVRDERCADILTMRQGIEGITRALTALGGRFGKIESSLTQLSQSIDDNKGLKEQVRTVECLLNELLEKSDDPDADKTLIVQHDVAVMTEGALDRDDVLFAEASPSCMAAPLTPLLTTLPVFPSLSSSPIPSGSDAHVDSPSAHIPYCSANARTSSPLPSTALAVRANASASSSKEYAEASTSTDSLSSTQPSLADFVDAVKGLARMLSYLSSSGQLPASLLDTYPLAHFILPQQQSYGNGSLSEHFSSELTREAKGKGRGRGRELPLDGYDYMPKRLSPAKWDTRQVRSSSMNTPDLTESPATCTSSLPSALDKRRRALLDTAVKPRGFSASESERRTRRLSVSSSFSNLSSSRQTSPGPTVTELKKRWAPSSQDVSQLLEDPCSQSISFEVYHAETRSQLHNEQSLDAQTPATARQSVEDDPSAMRQFQINEVSERQGRSSRGTRTPSVDPSSMTPYLSSDPCAIAQHVELLVSRVRMLDPLPAESIRELEMDAESHGQPDDSDAEGVKDLLGDDAEAVDAFPGAGIEREEKLNVVALTEQSVQELEARFGAGLATSRIAPPSSMRSESSLSSLTSFNSCVLDSHSGSNSNHTAQEYLQMRVEEKLSEFEEEETTRAELPLSLFSSGKRKRRSTNKAQAAADERAKRQKVTAALFPATPPNTLATAGETSLAGSIFQISTSSIPSGSTSKKDKGHDGIKSSSAGTSISAPPPSKKRKISKNSAPSPASASTSRVLVKPTSVPGKTAKKSAHWEVLAGYNGPCKWPKILGKGGWVGDFIQCSGCEAWYHFGCLSVKKNDPRTAEGVDLFCPPCEASIKQHGVARKLRNIIDQCCARPDCTLHDVGASNDHKTYFLERIIGRIPCAPSGNGVSTSKAVDFMWLFKWMNYEASQCTWEDSSKLPTNCDRFIAEFERTARAEGFVVGDPMGYIVLQEGARAGWRRPGWY